jgi:hypothetical protein
MTQFDSVMRCVRAAETAALQSNSPAYLFRRLSDHANQFSSARLSGGNGNGRSWRVQKFGKELDACFVGFAINGRRGERNFERVAEYTGDGIFPGAGMDLDGKGHATARLLDGNQEFSKENAVSTSNNAVSKGTAGLCSVRDLPMLAISAIPNINIVTFAVMQDGFRPFTPEPLRMRNPFSMAVNSKARPVPSIQILPV